MKRLTFPGTICLVLATIEYNMAQNPFYGNQTPPPYNNDQDSNTRRPNDSNYDRYNSDSNNRYDPYNRNNNDPSRYNDTNNRYNDPYNRYNDSSNRYNPYDPYNRNNDSNRYNDPYNKNYDSNRYNDPNNRYNDSGNRYNDPNNRYNDPNNRYNDPNNRYNDPNTRYNDPNNRYNQDPNNRYNQDQYNRYNTSQPPYNLGSDLNPNYRNNDRYNTPYNQDPNSPNNRYNSTNNNYNNPFNQDPNRYNSNNQYNRNNDPNNRYNQQNQYNRFNQGSQYNNSYGQYNQQNRQYDSPFGSNQNPNGQQYDAQNDPNDNCCEDYCYRADENPFMYFGSKTAYQIIYGRRDNQNVPECSAVQIWSINRHGTRSPTQQEIRRLRELNKLKEQILKNYDERRSFPYKGKLCPDDLDLLRRWRWNDTITEDKERVLSSQGIEDAKLLARRYKSKYFSLLNQPFKDNYYNFQYDTSDYKTHDTYQAYIEGLFDLNKSFMVHANTDVSERTLPPSYCKTWSRDVENNNYTYNEYERFKQRQEYMQMTRDIFKRLGFRYTLNEATVRDMYDMCRYEKAWNLNQPSPWCTVFTKKQLEMLEYAEDLQDYYHSGYGSEANAKVGCLLVKDMYDMMKKTVNGAPADAYKVSNYFTQSTQFLRFLTAMGIARDNSPLTADSFYQQKNRQWKLSLIDPFGANLVAVLYNCQRENKFRVMFLLNEVPVNFPECSVGLCDWNTVEQKFRSIAENCNKDYCDHGNSTIRSSIIHFIPILIISISVFYLF